MHTRSTISRENEKKRLIEEKKRNKKSTATVFGSSTSSFKFAFALNSFCFLFVNCSFVRWFLGSIET